MSNNEKKNSRAGSVGLVTLVVTVTSYYVKSN